TRFPAHHFLGPPGTESARIGLYFELAVVPTVPAAGRIVRAPAVARGILVVGAGRRAQIVRSDRCDTARPPRFDSETVVDLEAVAGRGTVVQETVDQETSAALTPVA